MDTESPQSLKRQKLLILFCCLVYSFAYAGRYGYNANINPIMAFYDVNRAEAGLVSTFFFFSYGAGQMIHAVFCRFYPKRQIITGSLLISSVINLVVFLRPSFGVIKYLWALNGICQSVLWPTLILILSENLGERMMKRSVVVMSFPVMAGTLIAYGGSALFNMGDGKYFHWIFLLGTILMTAIALVWFFVYPSLKAGSDLRNAREGVGSGKSVSEPLKTERTAREERAKVFTVGLIGLLAVCALFAMVDNFVKDGINTWTPTILKEHFGFPDSASIVLTLILPIFGMLGAVLSVMVNRFLRDFRAMIGFLYALTSLCLAGILFALRENGAVLLLVLLAAISCLAHAINNVLTCLMPLQMREKVNSGFLAGFLNSCCYIGSTASAYGLGKIADSTGGDWSSVVRVLLATAIGSAVLAAIALLIDRLRHTRKVPVQP